MSDFHDCGRLKVIAIKKCGSSTLRRTFAEKTWGASDFLETRYVTCIRHPAARLVSAWNHLVKKRFESDPAFRDRKVGELDWSGPPLSFEDWVDWVIETPDSDLDHHIASQVHDIVGRIHEVQVGNMLWIGQLERLNECEWYLRKYCKRQLGIAGSAGSHVRHRHGPWPEYYDRRLLHRVRERFRDDMRLWLRLYGDGYWVSGVDRPLLAHFVWSEAYQSNKIV